MATIGTFTKHDNGSFTGAVKTLSLNVKATITPGREGQRQGPRLPHLRRLDRVRRRLEEDLRGGPRLPLGQAGRPELPRPDLRQPGRRRERSYSLIWSRRNAD